MLDASDGERAGVRENAAPVLAEGNHRLIGTRRRQRFARARPPRRTRTPGDAGTPHCDLNLECPAGHRKRKCAPRIPRPIDGRRLVGIEPVVVCSSAWEGGRLHRSSVVIVHVLHDHRLGLRRSVTQGGLPLGRAFRDQAARGRRPAGDFRCRPTRIPS
jgi:hypothetical protein